MEQATTSSSSGWMQDAVKKGLILGAIHIVVFVTLYYVLPSKLSGFSYLLFIIVLNLVFMISQGRQWRNENLGGFMPYGDAFKYLFVLLAVNSLLGIIFNLIFLLIEPNMPQVMADSQLDTSVYWASKMGAPEGTLDKMREDFDSEDVTKRYGPMGAVWGVGIGAILWAIGASIAALFVRKNVPEVM